MMKQRVTTQEEILEHALKIAIEEGVDKVSIRKLATSCGIAVGSMYNYYKDKESFIKKTGGLHKIVACLIAFTK